VWKSSRREILRHIQIAPLGEGWSVAEATVDNAQFFTRRCDAETAARSLGTRLADVGEPSEISIRLGDGASGGRFVCAMREPRARVDP
jgi:hypothetical protein